MMLRGFALKNAKDNWVHDDHNQNNDQEPSIHTNYLVESKPPGRLALFLGQAGNLFRCKQITNKKFSHEHLASQCPAQGSPVTTLSLYH